MSTIRFLYASAIVLLFLAVGSESVCANPQDPVIGFETFYGGASRIDALGITRSGLVERLTIQGGLLSHREDGNALLIAGAPAASVVDCVKNANNWMAVVTESGGIVGCYVSVRDLNWSYVGNIFTLAATDANGAKITGVTYSQQDCTCVIVVASDGRVLWGDSQGGQWTVLGNIDDQPVGVEGESWGTIKSRYR